MLCTAEQSLQVFRNSMRASSGAEAFIFTTDGQGGVVKLSARVDVLLWLRLKIGMSTISADLATSMWSLNLPSSALAGETNIITFIPALYHTISPTSLSPFLFFFLYMTQDTR